MIHILMPQRRHNQRWTAPELIGSLPIHPSEFERLVQRLRLEPEQYAASRALRDWVTRNWQQRFVPEDLLRAWGFTHEAQQWLPILVRRRC